MYAIFDVLFWTGLAAFQIFVPPLRLDNERTSF